MAQPTILTDRDGPLLTVTLNRPEKANALSRQMLGALIETLQTARQDHTLNALILTGAGERVFSAGADLSELSTEPTDPSLDLWEDLATAFEQLPILAVAALIGPCIGGGLTLALGCDIRIGVGTTRFQYPVLKNGVLPGKADTRRLQQLIGPGRTASLLLGGQSVEAETAVSWGLMDYLVLGEELSRTARAMTEVACAAPRDHIVAMKRLCQEG